MSSLHWDPISKAKCPDGIPTVYSPCPDFTPSLQPMYREYFMSTVEILPLLHLCSTSTVHVPSVHHLSCPCQVSTPYLLPMSCQNTNILPITSQNSTSTAHVESKHHLSYPSSVKITHFLPKPSWYTTSPQVQSVHHLSCPCQKTSCLCHLRMLPLLPMSHLNTTSFAHNYSVGTPPHV